MINLAYRPFDCDNHYYEALDAFTRHLDPRWAQRTVMWCDIGGRKYHVVGGKVSYAVTNPTFDPIAKAGAMHDYFRGNPEGKSPIEFLRDRESIRPEYRDRDARIRVLKEQGVEACWLFPTLGVLYEELLKNDTEAVTVLFRAFNEWLLEDWGVCYQDTIMAAPYIPMVDPDFARSELEWALEKGARVVCMRPAAAVTAGGSTSPADPIFDGFWGLANEAGICVVVHAGDSGYSNNGYVKDGFSANITGGDFRPSVKTFAIERAAYDFLITLVFEKHFERFPNVRIASIENGSEFLPDMFKKLRSTADKFPGYFKEDPIETFKRNVWINPFWEDDVYEVEALMGADRVIFGSDWPHIEGMPEPIAYLSELVKFDDETKRKILRDNGRELNQLRPA